MHSVGLTRANVDLQQFAYIASHDLQEPARTVSVCAELLSEKIRAKLDPEEQELLEYISGSARRMTLIIKDLLAYSRSLNEELPQGPIDVSEVVAWALNNLHLAIESSGAEISYSAEALPTIHANKIALMHIFQNLLSNAIKYRGADPPRVEISALRRDGHWMFSVRDNGIGIDPAYHERIFVLFRRLHTSQEYPGTGIGLALCRKMILALGGKIWAEAQAGQGSTLNFTVPVREVT